MHESRTHTQALTKAPAARVDVSIQRNLWLALAGLLGFAALMGLVGVTFDRQLMAVTEWVAATVGIGGLVGIVFMSDSVLSPIAPDLVLLVIAHSSLAQQGLWLAFVLGIVSWVAGGIGWWCGVRLRSTSVPRWVFGRSLAENQALIQRHGRWAVAVGALTPVPFSLTCWTAGMLGMPLRDVMLCGSLRLPRIFAAYVCIAYAADLFRLFLP